jgi:lysyl-tRNA synthetase class 2
MVTIDSPPSELPAAPPSEDRRRRGWLAPLAASLTAAVALLNLASALTPNFAGRIHVLLRIEGRGFVPIAHALALVAGVALVVLAFGLARRRRRALELTVLVLAIAGILNLVKGLDIEEGLANWALAGLLIWGRGAFYVRHERDSLRSALKVVPALIVLAFGVAFLAVRAGASHWSWSAGADETFWLLLMTSGPLHFHRHFHWIPTAIAILSAGTLVAIAWRLFRPLAAPFLRTDATRSAAVDLVRRHGDDTLSFFKLREDKHHLFSSDHQAFVGYTVESGVMLVSGDPVGPPEELPALARDVRAFAEVRGLKLSVLGASETTRSLWEEQGLRSFYIGDEAVVDVASFSLEGRPIRKVRQSVTRLAKGGYTASIHPLGTLSERELCELERISDRWLAGTPERGFSMAMDSLRGEHLDDSLVVVARDGDGAVRGFLHFVPVYGRRAVSLSFMRRDRDTPNGLTEYMVVRAIELLREQRIDELSLNFAAFARLMHSPSNAFERFLGRLASIFNPYFQIESLYRFNAKFFPRWEPRYLLYDGPLGLPRAGLAAMWAEGQLPKPRIGSGKAAG